jgi:hypothetical protein
VTISYADRIGRGCDPPYAFPSPAVLVFAEATTRAYLDLVDEWESDTLDGEGVPRPATTLRAVPPV